MSKSVVTAYALNVRAGPSTAYKIVAQLLQNAAVDVLGQSGDGSWKEVRTAAGVTGWCASRYLLPIEPEPEPDPNQPPAEFGIDKVTAYSLYMRAGPSTSYAVVGVLRKDETVTVLEISQDGFWKKIRTASTKTGWASARYLSTISSGPPPAGDETRTGMHRVLADVLNLREAAGLDQRIVGTLKLEEIVNVSEVSADLAWKRITTVSGSRGWCATSYLASLGEEGAVLPKEEFPWMPVAFGELGVREVAGTPSNPNVLEYLMSTDLPNSALLPDETDWCAAFVTWCLKQAGIATIQRNAALVNPWLNWGKPISTPRRGCIVIFHWLDGGAHMSFYTGGSGAYVRALGGNQSDAVWIKSYPKAEATSYRIPADWPG